MHVINFIAQHFNNIELEYKLKKVNTICAFTGEVVKGVDMLGFIGNFYTNAIIPSYLGLGKLVSRGFGSILRINN